MSYLISGTAYYLSPTDLFYCLLYTKSDILELPKKYPFKGEWGKATSCIELENEELPQSIEISYLSVIEKSFYYLQIPLNFDLNRIIEDNTEKTLIVGMSPYGGVAVWYGGKIKSMLVCWEKGELTEVDMEDFAPMNTNIGMKEYCDFYINNDSIVKENLKTNGLPPRNLFDKYMQQFTYRYQPLFEKWDDGEEVKWQKYKEDELSPEFEYIDESLYDGTHDKLHDGGLMKYHQAGKPKKLRVEWHIGKSEYSAYFWFEDERIREVFDKFYGAHPETKTDFIIRIDAEKRKYELALYRYGLKEPQVIPEDVYQLLVFKNKFEDYRSDNYNQERGAWIW